jgi:hypothetical protein
MGLTGGGSSAAVAASIPALEGFSSEPKWTKGFVWDEDSVVRVRVAGSVWKGGGDDGSLTSMLRKGGGKGGKKEKARALVRQSKGKGEEGGRSGWGGRVPGGGAGGGVRATDNSRA